MDIDAICTKIADEVRDVPGIVASDPCVVDLIHSPHFYIGEIGIQYDQTFGGDQAVTLVCRLLVSKEPGPEAQAALKRYMRSRGSYSIKAAIERADVSALCDDLHVPRMQGHRMYTVAEVQHFGAEWPVLVIGNGDDEEDDD